jgi:hypothetical protein
MMHRTGVANDWAHSSGTAKIGVRKTWLGVWILGAIGLLLLFNLGCNGCGSVAEDAVEEAKDAAAEAAEAAGEVIEEGAEGVGEAVDEGAEAVGEALEEAKETAGEVAEEAGKAVKEAGDKA